MSPFTSRDLNTKDFSLFVVVKHWPEHRNILDWGEEFDFIRWQHRSPQMGGSAELQSGDASKKINSITTWCSPGMVLNFWRSFFSSLPSILETLNLVFEILNLPP
jgi:hypothetical protein